MTEAAPPAWLPAPVTRLLRRVVARTVRLSLRHPVQSLRWRRDVASARRGRFAILNMGEGWTLRCHPASVAPFTLQRDQPELRAELDAFRAAITPGAVLFDIGCHYGLFTLAAVHASGGNVQVVAVDPSPDALAVLAANLRLNGASAKVRVERAAVGDADGTVALLTGGAAAYHMMTAADGDRPDAADVPLVAMNTLAARHQLSPTHVKIDVEGAEERVLRGGGAVLAAARPLLFLEVHAGLIRGGGGAPESVFERLRAAGYTRYEMGGRPVSEAEACVLDVARILCRP